MLLVVNSAARSGKLPYIIQGEEFGTKTGREVILNAGLFASYKRSHLVKVLAVGYNSMLYSVSQGPCMCGFNGGGKAIQVELEVEIFGLQYLRQDFCYD